MTLESKTLVKVPIKSRGSLSTIDSSKRGFFCYF